MTELDNLKTLSFGTSQIIKNMPDYEEAIEKLKEESAREHGEGEEVVSDGKTGK